MWLLKAVLKEGHARTAPFPTKPSFVVRWMSLKGFFSMQCFVSKPGGSSLWHPKGQESCIIAI